MLFFGIKNLWFRIGISVVVSAWAAVTLYAMYQNFYVADPYNPALTLTDAYGHNGAEAFQTFSTVLLIECLILLIVLLPFSLSRLYWVRLLVLQIVAGGWLLLLAFGAMHSGGVYMIHLLAVFAVNVIIFVLLAASIAAEIVSRRKQSAALV